MPFMHKRNTVLIALLLAAPITIAITLWHRSDAVGVFYFPAIVLSVIFSGKSHSPGAIAEWSSFIVYTLLYLVIFLVIYALLLESYLLRQGLAHLQEISDKEPSADSSPQARLEELGSAIRDVETKRRTHWLLANTDSIDLSEPPDLLGARALDAAALRGPAKGIMKELTSKLIKQRGAAAAEAEIQRLKTGAKTRLAGASRAGS
jgi:hypothetical protein